MATRNIYILILTCLSSLTFSQTTHESKNATRDSLMKQLHTGNDSISLIIDIYKHNRDLTEDSLLKLLSISNQNYLSNDNTRKTDPDLQLRYIFFSDQYYRIKCYAFNEINYDIVKRNDSILQALFLTKINIDSLSQLMRNNTFQMTFDLLLIHSVKTQTGFFENNFNKYTGYFSNNFKEYGNIRTVLDLYLNIKFNKQYFGTAYGQGRLSNDTFGLLPQITKDELRVILTNLKIDNAAY